MFKFLKNIYKNYKIKHAKFKITPKGQCLMKYLENQNNNIKQDKIQAYDDIINRICENLNESCLEREKEYLHNNINIKTLKVKVISEPESKLSWYYNSIGKVFDVYNYDKNSYSLIGKDFGFLIQKNDAIIID